MDVNMATNISADKLLDDLISQAKRSEPEAQQAYERFKATQREFWIRWAGSAVDEMLLRREKAEEYLADADPKRRMVALDVLRHHWKPDANLGIHAEKLAFEDPDPEVRKCALVVLGACYSGTEELRILARLAQVVQDSSVKSKMREAAYLGMLHASDIPLRSWPDLALFRFPEDVDWSFVNRYQSA
jgi:hypothetical protein